MKYKYECKECKEFSVIEKSMNDSGRVEHCQKCGTELIRVYSVGAIKTGDGVK